MGKEKTSGSTTQVINQTTTQTPQPTPEETALNQRNLRIAQATEAPETQAQLSGLNLINRLLTGQLPQGELFSQIGGINPEAISQQAAQMTRSYMPNFQSLGIADSGSAYKALTKEIANSLIFPAQQFNVGAGQNLLNLALSGQAQVQAPIQANVSNLSASLAGLRPITSASQGTQMGTTSQYGMNPFLKSFQTQAGKTLGGGQFGFNYYSSI